MGVTFKKWKHERTLAESEPFIPDHAEGFHMFTMVDVWGPHERQTAHGLDWIWRTFPGQLFYPELIERYYTAIITEGELIKPKDEYQRPAHLVEMLIKLDSDESMSLTKKHRWLGYIQGVLCANGVISVDDERDHTRGIFNGA